MMQAVDIQQVIIQGIKDLPQQYLDEVAESLFFLREKRIKQQLPNNEENQERKKAMLRMIREAKYNAPPTIDPSIDIRALIDQTHDSLIK
jgi:hypothetical protein